MNGARDVREKEHRWSRQQPKSVLTAPPQVKKHTEVSGHSQCAQSVSVSVCAAVGGQCSVATFFTSLTFAVDVVVGHSVRWREVTEGSKK